MAVCVSHTYLHICTDDRIDRIHHRASRATANYQLQRNETIDFARGNYCQTHLAAVCLRVSPYFFSFFTDIE